MLTAMPIQYMELPTTESPTMAVSAEATSLHTRYAEAFAHFTTTYYTETLAQKFDRLASNWKEQTKYLSAVSKIILHPSYQQIIAMGPVVIPFILQRMQKEPSYWFDALQALTSGADPILPNQYGNMQAMTSAWLQWGKDNGYVS